jgi:hypothetical protein
MLQCATEPIDNKHHKLRIFLLRIFPIEKGAFSVEVKLHIVVPFAFTKVINAKMLFYFIFSNSVNPRKPPGPREMCSRTGERSEATSTS